MAKSHPTHKQPSGGGGRTNFASCIVAAVFLIFLIVVAFVVYFTIFKPKDPKLTVSAIRVPVFSAANSTVNFTFSQYVTINNPNRAEFTHYDSSLQLLYAGNQVGLLFVPAGKIAAEKNQYMTATFAVNSFPLTVPGQPPSVAYAPNGFRLGPNLEVQTRLEMAGRVRVLHFFTHHVEARAQCRVAIAISDGSVLGFLC